MFYKREHWEVLVVDDDESIHAVTELALKREKIFGLPLKLCSAFSAAEARQFFETKSGDMWRWRHLPVALIDVVMETQDAGLELCRYIREEACNPVVRLVLRTGQPGLAPPRQIIDDYGVSGYLLKTEVSRERLYMEIKSAIETFLGVDASYASSYRLELLRNLRPRDADALQRGITRILTKVRGDTELELHVAIDLGNLYVGSGEFAEEGTYRKLSEDVLPQAEPQLKQRSGLWSRLSSSDGVALVDDLLISQAVPIGSKSPVTVMIRIPKLSPTLIPFLGVLWRQEALYMAEVAAGLMTEVS